jgi:glycosyltransferase involved in cell wall biosynthesis
VPPLDRELNRRRVSGLPVDLVRTRWHWEGPRVAANRLGLPRLEHHIWEQAERALARAAASLLEQPAVTGVLGVEHGALEALAAARRLAKTGFLAYLSPHHRTMRQWLEPEFERWPELGQGSRARVSQYAHRGNARRDEETRLADWIVTGSTFTTQSLTAAGVPAAKIMTVPLGGPEPIPANALPAAAAGPVRFAHVGLVAVHKGSHLLLRAWRRVAGRGAELHVFGKSMLPESVIRGAKESRGGASVVFHGSIPSNELRNVYLQSTILVMPTLCDGFGQVISEALAHGLPVITTRNAGAADLIRHGESGLIVPPGDEDALAEALAWCLDHPHELVDMRRAALASARARTWPVFRRDFGAALLAASAAGSDAARRWVLG